MRATSQIIVTGFSGGGTPRGTRRAYFHNPPIFHTHGRSSVLWHSLSSLTAPLTRHSCNLLPTGQTALAVHSPQAKRERPLLSQTCTLGLHSSWAAPEGGIIPRPRLSSLAVFSVVLLPSRSFEQLGVPCLAESERREGIVCARG